MHRTSLAILFVSALLASCHGGKAERQMDREACDSAEAYYGYLIRGEYNQYVSRLYGYENMCTAQREQMAKLMEQYVGKEQRMRNGVKEVSAVRDTIIDNQAQVLLLLTYGNGDTEQVAMPLILDDDGWRMQ